MALPQPAPTPVRGSNNLDTPMNHPHPASCKLGAKGPSLQQEGRTRSPGAVGHNGMEGLWVEVSRASGGEPQQHVPERGCARLWSRSLAAEPGMGLSARLPEGSGQWSLFNGAGTRPWEEESTCMQEACDQAGSRTQVSATLVPCPRHPNPLGLGGPLHKMPALCFGSHSAPVSQQRFTALDHPHVGPAPRQVSSALGLT